MLNKAPVKLCSFTFMLICCLLPTVLSDLGGLSAAWAARSGDVSVKVAVEKETVAQGEPFVFQIQLEGSDMGPGSAQPDMSGLKDFLVEPMGGQSNNRSSISIINGSMTRVESSGYVYSFRLTPKKTGKLVIPSIAVAVDSSGSKVLQTDPVIIRVTAPETSDDFQVEVSYSKTRFYVGEPVLMTVTWYLSRDVESVGFNLPVLETEGLTARDLKIEDPAKREGSKMSASDRLKDPKADQEAVKQYIQLPLGQGSVMAEKGQKTYKGSEYTTLTFRKVLLAREPGTFQIPESTVSSKALVGSSKSNRSRNPFDSVFDDDFFSMGRREVRKTFVARSDPVTLTAMALPQQGKPAHFSGCVGSYSIETSASSTDVGVGDPLTLTISISGSEYLENVELPPLSKDPELERDFKIPDEMAAGLIKNGSKIFAQTLRAKSEEVKAIPPVRFSYFDPQRGEYQTAASKPIALRVKPTRIVTEADVEGRVAPKSVKNELEAWSEGIAYNYEGPEVLENQKLTLSTLVRSPLWMMALVLPFSLYMALFVRVQVKRSQMSDPDRSRSRRALATFTKRIKALGSGELLASQSCTDLLDAVRCYLGDKLRLDGAALTFADVQKHLRDRGIDNEITSGLEVIFSLCELGRYGGGVGSAKPLDDLVEDAFQVIRSLDQKL